MYRKRFTIEFDENLMERVTTPGCRGVHKVGSRRVQAQVELELDDEASW